MANLSCQAITGMRFPSFAKAALAGLILGLSIAVSGASASPAKALDPAIVIDQCPARITTQQSVRDPASGWIPQRRDVGHLLAGMGFFQGPVSRRQELAPEASSDKVAAYDFAGHVEPIWFACEYRGTDMMLTRQLPAHVKKCTNTTVKIRGHEDGYIVKCR